MGQTSDDDAPRYLEIPPAQIATLLEVVETLATDLSRLPSQGSWREIAGSWQRLLGKYLGIDDDSEPAGGNSSPHSGILAILRELTGLDAIENTISLSEFSRTFKHWLEHWKISEDRRNRDGVMVLSGTEARGLPFRALFVLGLNEGVFPRTVREDAFLRDSDRNLMERDLGYKLNSKLAGFDEEKLLFMLLVGAA